MPLAKKFIILDTETTDFVENGGRLAEIAMIQIESATEDGKVKFKVTERLEELINPESDFSESAAKVNGLSLEMLKGKPKFADIADRVLELLKRKIPIVAYNSNFDRKIIASEFQRLGMKMPFIEIIDVFFLAKQKIKPDDERLALLDSGRRSYAQTSVAKALGIDISGAHRASNDVKILYYLYKALVDLPDIKKLKTKQEMISDATENKNESVKTEIVKKDNTIEKIKEIIISNLSAVSIAEIAAKSVLLVKKTIDENKTLIDISNSLSVESDSDSLEAVNLLADLSKLKTKITKERQILLSPLKKVTNTIEFIFRDFLVLEIDDAHSALQDKRSNFLRKKYEKEKAEAIKARDEQEAKAQKEGQKIFDVLKDKNLDLAIEESLKIYEAELAAKKVQEPTTVNKITTEKASSKDEILFEIEIVDEAVIPDEYWSPDKEKILAYVNKFNGNVNIPGVTITPISKSRITNKRR